MDYVTVTSVISYNLCVIVICDMTSYPLSILKIKKDQIKTKKLKIKKKENK